jgi:hypothetical protein
MNQDFEHWCKEVTAKAEFLSGKMIRFEEVSFNWADRWKDGDPVNAVAANLVVIAVKQISTICGFRTNL